MAETGPHILLCCHFLELASLLFLQDVAEEALKLIFFASRGGASLFSITPDHRINSRISLAVEEGGECHHGERKGDSEEKRQHTGHCRRLS